MTTTKNIQKKSHHEVPIISATSWSAIISGIFKKLQFNPTSRFKASLRCEDVFLLPPAAVGAPGDPDEHAVRAHVAPVPAEAGLALAGAGLAVARGRHGALRVAAALLAAEAGVGPVVGLAHVALLSGHAPVGWRGTFTGCDAI